MLLLLACGYPSYYPRAEYLPLESAPPPECAEPTGEPVELFVIDQSALQLNLYSLDVACRESFVVGLTDGQPWRDTSEVGAAFVVRDASNALVESLVIPAGDSTYTWTIQ